MFSNLPAFVWSGHLVIANFCMPDVGWLAGSPAHPWLTQSWGIQLASMYLKLPSAPEPVVPVVVFE